MPLSLQKEQDQKESEMKTQRSWKAKFTEIRIKYVILSK